MASVPPTGKPSGSVAKSEALQSQRKPSCEVTRILSHPRSALNRRPPDTPSEPRTSHGISALGIPIRTLNSTIKVTRPRKHVTDATDEFKAVRTLAKILVDREGRTFISRLERKEAELCIETLGHVGRDLRLLPFSLSHMVL
jgi:hypothetical protein